jgi:hypothetical protein
VTALARVRNPAVAGQALLRRALVVWLVLIGVEFIHGILRAIFLVRVVGDFPARQIGVFTGSALILLVACLFAPWLRAPDTKALMLIGVLWLVLTVGFELGFGHFVFGRSWESLGEDYDVPHGGLLPFGLMVLTFSPLIAARVRGLRR